MVSSRIKIFFTVCCVLGVKYTKGQIMHKQDAHSSPQLITNSTTLSYGDLALTPFQRYALGTKRKLAYNAVLGINHRWRNGVIPYVIGCSVVHLTNAVDAINKAIAQWEEKTCIRFVKRTNEKHYLKFFRDTHCYGSIGQASPSIISIGYGCEHDYVMAHEIGHAIGLFHEHNRPDRDQWIDIQPKNIGWHKEAFRIIENSQSFGVPYDYESIMHYPWNAFSINGHVTMVPRKSSNGKKPYSKISVDDVKLVSKMYNCPAIERKRRRQRVTSRVQSPSTPSATLPQPFTWTGTWPNRNYLGVGLLCKDGHKECTGWAAQGSCVREQQYMFRRCQQSCKRLNFDIECDLEVRKPPGACNEPLGLQRRDDGSHYTLPDSAFTASTELTAGDWSAPASSARLYNADNYSMKRIGSWCADDRRPHQYVQVDLGVVKTITFIATQGRPKYYERVSKFRVQYSNTPSETDFTTYQENGEDKEFNGNCDHRSPVLNPFHNTITARYLRYVPVKWNYPCVRLELFGC